MLEPASGFGRLKLREFWTNRELLYFLVWRDVKVRYKQTVIGVAWAILQPVLVLALFSLIFGRLARIDPGGVPYPAFAFAGLVAWQLLAFSLTDASRSLVTNKDLITKVYFPRILVPTAVVVAALVDFGLAFVVLTGLLAWYGILPTLAVVALPAFLVLAVGTALAAAFWLSALNVRYRDVQYTVPFLTQFWFFATPIVYPTSLIPEHLRLVFGLNPMAGVVEGIRWALFSSAGAPSAMVFVSAAVVVVLLLGGIAYYRSVESSFADIV